MIKIPLKIGDKIYVGRFKNKEVEVKTISTDPKNGQPLINGKNMLTFRIKKLMPKTIKDVYES